MDGTFHCVIIPENVSSCLYDLIAVFFPSSAAQLIKKCRTRSYHQYLLLVLPPLYTTTPHFPSLCYPLLELTKMFIFIFGLVALYMQGLEG